MSTSLTFDELRAANMARLPSGECQLILQALDQVANSIAPEHITVLQRDSWIATLGDEVARAHQRIFKRHADRSKPLSRRHEVAHRWHAGIIGDLVIEVECLHRLKSPVSIRPLMIESLPPVKPVWLSRFTQVQP